MNEFTLTLSDDIVKAALRGDSPEPDEEPEPIVPERSRSRAQDTLALPQDPPSGVVRFTPPRPGSRSLPPPQSNGPAVEPLTTGVVMPGSEVGPYTAELVYDGLDDRGREKPKERPSAFRSERGAKRPSDRGVGSVPPPSEPVSASLPDVPMPPPDLARARPANIPPRPSTMRPQPAARPEARPGRQTARPPVNEAGDDRRLEELLTLADEPPEREDTASRSIDLLSIADAPPGQESTLGGPGATPAVDPLARANENARPDAPRTSLPPKPPAPRAPAPRAPAPKLPAPRAPVETEFHSLGAAFVQPPVGGRQETLTEALVLLEEGERPTEIAPESGPVPASKSPKAIEPTVETRPAPASLEATIAPPISEGDPLATRRLPKRTEPTEPTEPTAPTAIATEPAAPVAPPPAEAVAAPAPAAKPASVSPSNEPTVLTALPSVVAPASDAKKSGDKAADSTKTRRESYKPKPSKDAAPKEKEGAAGDSFGTERDYREPILAWLASLVGLVVIAGGIFIALLVAIAIMR